MEKAILFSLIFLSGYLIGSISFARIIYAVLKPNEKPVPLITPTKDGKAGLISHKVGATSVMIRFGSRWGMLTTLLDAAKVFVPTLLFSILFPNEKYFLVVAVAVLVGHLWPLWYKFSGGGGNSCILGMLLAISPVGLVASHIGGMLIGMKFPMFSFLGGVALTIPWFAIRNGIFSAETIFAFIITILYVVAQIPEAIQIYKLKKAGHTLEIRHIMNLMKKSASAMSNESKTD